MAAYSATLQGASEVYVVDRVPERLAKAKEIGCVPIDFSKGDPVKQIKDARGGLVYFLLRFELIAIFPRKEVDRGVDGRCSIYLHPLVFYVNCFPAVGSRATSLDGKREQPNTIIEALVSLVRPTGGLGIPGLYVPSDHGAPDASSAKYSYSYILQSLNSHELQGIYLLSVR